VFAQRRQRRCPNSIWFAKGPWHFAQRESRMTTWWERQALVAVFSA
jgi:hypothetical protein